MTRSPLTRRYARALFELAREQNRLDAIERDAGALAEFVRDRDTMVRLMNPRIVRDRTALWTALLGGKIDPLTLRFLLFTIQKGRGALLAGILADFVDLCLETRGIQPIEIISACPLTDSQVQAIVERMRARLQRNVHPTVRVQPSLLGGFQVRVRDTIYDYSLNHQLERLHRSLLTA